MGEEDSRSQMKYLDTLGFVSDEENTVNKACSISKAWREGTTPVQRKQQQQMVSIERLLATNRLNSVLKGVTPVKSPCMGLVKHHFTDIKTQQTGEVTEVTSLLEESMDKETSVKSKLADSKTLSKELIVETIGNVRKATEELLLLFKRVSLDEDLEDSLRGDLMMLMTEGAADNLDNLRLVQAQDRRSQSEIAEAAMETIRNFQKS